jgi:hypothetical protein
VTPVGHQTVAAAAADSVRNLIIIVIISGQLQQQTVCAKFKSQKPEHSMFTEFELLLATFASYHGYMMVLEIILCQTNTKGISYNTIRHDHACNKQFVLS